MTSLQGKVAIVTGGSREIGVAMAEALLYLVSPEAYMVNGHILMIDGGWTTVGHVP